MLFNLFNMVELRLFNKKNWFENYKFNFVQNVILILIIVSPSLMYFSSNRLILLFSFSLVLFIINLAMIEVFYSSQLTQIAFIVDSLKNSYNSILYINNKIKSIGFINSKNSRYIKLNTFFLWYIKYSILINDRSFKKNIINMY